MWGAQTHNGSVPWPKFKLRFSWLPAHSSTTELSLIWVWLTEVKIRIPNVLSSILAIRNSPHLSAYTLTTDYPTCTESNNAILTYRVWVNQKIIYFTGKLDEKTRLEMALPRCDFPDLETPESKRRIKRFNLGKLLNIAPRFTALRIQAPFSSYVKGPVYNWMNASGNRAWIVKLLTCNLSNVCG